MQLAQDDWNSTLHRADNHAARAAELTAAGHSDNAFARKLAQAEQRWLCEERQLDDAFTEQHRRTQLTPPQRDLEDRARRHLDRDAHDGLAFAQPTALTETGASREEPVDTPEIGTDYEYSYYDYDYDYDYGL
ncbi:hypothetical protein [Nocardia sp. NPDC004260]